MEMASCFFLPYVHGLYVVDVTSVLWWEEWRVSFSNSSLCFSSKRGCMPFPMAEGLPYIRENARTSIMIVSHKRIPVARLSLLNAK